MPKMVVDPSYLLEKEIRVIFDEIFGFSPQPQSIAAYLQFHIVYGQALLKRKGVDLNKVVSKHLDVEAVEFFLRTRFPGNLLTCKVWACAYFCEAQKGVTPSGRSRARLDSVKSPLICLLMLGWFGLRSGAKWLKGAFQVYRHRLV
jgi:hypothetical protein